MATGDQNSWWGSFMKSAKEKSISAFELIKNDLTEFTQTMTNDANGLFSQASTQFIEKSSSVSLLKQSDSDKTNQANKPTQKTSNVQARYNEELESIQKNEELYLNNEIESNEEFIQWLTTFNPDNSKSVISDLLIENSSMRLLYSQMVPAQISNHQFWSRYFFKVTQLDEEHKKRIKLLERANEKSNDESDGLDWENEEDAQSSNVISSKTYEEEEKPSEQSNIELQQDKPKTVDEIQEFNDDSSQNQLGDEWEKVSDDNENNPDRLKLNAETELDSNKKEDENGHKKDEWDDWDN